MPDRRPDSTQRRREYIPWDDRFLGRFITAPNGCWEWQHTLSRDGYGQMSVDGRNRMAHRISYELYVGAIPRGLTLDHLCRNRRCVRPSHLEAVTQRENFHRGASPFRPASVVAEARA